MAAPQVASDSAKPSITVALPKIEHDGSQARCSVAIKKDTTLTSSGQSRQAQAAYRQRQKVIVPPPLFTQPTTRSPQKLMCASAIKFHEAN